MISIKTLVFNPFAENTYILYDDAKDCVIIDPGCYTKEEEHHLAAILDSESLTPIALLNTHCHIDHVLGNKFVSEQYNIPLQIPQDDKLTYDAVPSYAASYGFPEYNHLHESVLLKSGDSIKFGSSELKVLFVPGHSQGHIALVNENEKICIGGDVLFNGSIGRTDLPGGDYNTLINSIQQELFKLPEDTVVYPGHGPTTTIAIEKQSNPFCAIS